MRISFISGTTRLFAASAAILLIWGWGLPWIAQLPTIDKRLQFLDERGIDPSAMYYTELDAMDKILQRIEQP